MKDSIWSVAQLAKAIADTNRTLLDQTCGIAYPSALLANAANVEGAICTASTRLKEVQQTFQCSNWYSIYVEARDDFACYDGVDGLTWITCCEIVMIFFALVILTCRAALGDLDDDDDGVDRMYESSRQAEMPPQPPPPQPPPHQDIYQADPIWIDDDGLGNYGNTRPATYNQQRGVQDDGNDFLKDFSNDRRAENKSMDDRNSVGSYGFSLDKSDAYSLDKSEPSLNTYGSDQIYREDSKANEASTTGGNGSSFNPEWDHVEQGLTPPSSNDRFHDDYNTDTDDDEHEGPRFERKGDFEAV